MVFSHSLVFMIVVATYVAESASPHYIPGEWIDSEDTPQDDDYELPEDDENTADLPDDPTVTPGYSHDQTGVYSPLSPEDEQGPYFTPAPVDKQQPVYGMKGKAGMSDLAMWLVFLAVPMLLIAAMGSLALGYYLCVWRGGRIYYQAQRELLCKS